MIEKQRYVLGATVEVRAQLVDSRHAPLEMDEVTLDVIRPNGSLMPVMMKADTSRPGAFTGRFGALIPGNYQLELPVPDSTDVRLTGRIMVRIPDLERENPQRNDRLLQQIAKTTGGKFYIGTTALTGDSLDAPVAWFEDKTRTIVKTEFPDFWKQDWLHWLIYILCGLLFIEWIIRRLAKLA